MGAGGEAPADAFRAGDIAVLAGRQLGRRHVIGMNAGRKLHGLAEGVAGLERGDVDLGDVRNFPELVLEPVAGRGGLAVEEPQDQAERPHVLGAQRVLVGDLHVFDGLGGVLGVFGDLQRQHAVFLQAAVLERVGLVTGLLEIALLEGVLVDDEQAVVAQIAQVGDQRRGVHHHKHVERVTGGADLAGAEIDLEGGDPEGGADRRTDLGRKVGERHQVVAGDRRGQGELAAGQLHAVAGISGKPHHRRLELFTPVRPPGSRRVWLKLYCHFYVP